VLERNPSGSPAVLFLHGWLDHAHSHDWLRDALDPALRTIAVDFRGHGESAHAPGGLYHLTDYLVDVDFTLAALGVERVHLVGHSLGGTVALLYAAARPDRVLSVTSIESLGPSGGEPDQRTVQRLRGFLADLHRRPLRRTYASVDEAAARLRANNSSLCEEVALHLARHGTCEVNGGLTFTFDPAHRRRFGTTLDEGQLLALFGAVQCPVQIIEGTSGLSFDDVQMKLRLRALRAAGPLTVKGGHHLHLDAPEQVARLIEAFITAA
jgi:pimeloyl-ACP methyl ester carboxylesterase